MLITFFQGYFSLYSSVITFRFNDVVFYINRIARGGSGASSASTYPVLMTYLKSSPAFVLGNINSKKYCSLSFVLCTSKTISVDNYKFYFTSKENLFFNKVQTVLRENPKLCSSVFELFKKDFSHISVNSEIHVGGPLLLRKKTVLRYICLSEDIYLNPNILQPQLNTILQLMFKLNLEQKNITL
ncbi:MAG: hypothetical protein WA160_05405 [Pseudobdellovibrio sp.]